MGTDRFFAREAELARLAEFVAPGACVSVVGTEGLGKTRVAVEFVQRHLHTRWPAGVAWVDGRCGDSRLAKPGLGRAGSLLVIDAADGLSAAATATVAGFVASGAAVLATGRDVLGFDDERVLALAPLLGPGEPAPAEQLFAARVADAGGAFAPGDAARVPALIGLLDAIPLAIELTAARVADLGLPAVFAALKAKLDERAARGDRVVRSDVVRVAVAWAWDALEPWGRAALLPCALHGDGAVTAAGLDLGAGHPGRGEALETLVRRGVVRRELVRGGLVLPARLREHVRGTWAP